MIVFGLNVAKLKLVQWFRVIYFAPRRADERKFYEM